MIRLQPYVWLLYYVAIEIKASIFYFVYMTFYFTREEDVTKTMYTATYHEQTAKSSSATEAAKSSKIDAVCDVIRRALERIDPDK